MHRSVFLPDHVGVAMRSTQPRPRRVPPDLPCQNYKQAQQEHEEFERGVEEWGLRLAREEHEKQMANKEAMKSNWLIHPELTPDECIVTLEDRIRVDRARARVAMQQQQMTGRYGTYQQPMVMSGNLVSQQEEHVRVVEHQYNKLRHARSGVNEALASVSGAITNRQSFEASTQTLLALLLEAGPLVKEVSDYFVGAGGRHLLSGDWGLMWDWTLLKHVYALLADYRYLQDNMATAKECIYEVAGLVGIGEGELAQEVDRLAASRVQTPESMVSQHVHLAIAGKVPISKKRMLGSLWVGMFEDSATPAKRKKRNPALPFELKAVPLTLGRMPDTPPRPDPFNIGLATSNMSPAKVFSASLPAGPALVTPMKQATMPTAAISTTPAGSPPTAQATAGDSVSNVTAPTTTQSKPTPVPPEIKNLTSLFQGTEIGGNKSSTPSVHPAPTPAATIPPVTASSQTVPNAANVVAGEPMASGISTGGPASSVQNSTLGTSVVLMNAPVSSQNATDAAKPKECPVVSNLTGLLGNASLDSSSSSASTLPTQSEIPSSTLSSSESSNTSPGASFSTSGSSASTGTTQLSSSVSSSNGGSSSSTTSFSSTAASLSPDTPSPPSSTPPSQKPLPSSFSPRPVAIPTLPSQPIALKPKLSMTKLPGYVWKMGYRDDCQDCQANKPGHSAHWVEQSPAKPAPKMSPGAWQRQIRKKEPATAGPKKPTGVMKAVAQQRKQKKNDARMIQEELKKMLEEAEAELKETDELIERLQRLENGRARREDRDMRAPSPELGPRGE